MDEQKLSDLNRHARNYCEGTNLEVDDVVNQAVMRILEGSYGKSSSWYCVRMAAKELRGDGMPATSRDSTRVTATNKTRSLHQGDLVSDDFGEELVDQQDLLGILEPCERAVFDMTLEGMSITKIAKVLCNNRRTVVRWLETARAKLKEQL